MPSLTWLLDSPRSGTLRRTQARAEVIVMDGTGMRATTRRLGVNCNIALGISARSGPRRRRKAETVLLGLTVGQSWQEMAPQLQQLEPPAMVVVDGEPAITVLAESLWPDVPIQRCWWHLPRALRWALYADRAEPKWAEHKRAELAELLRTAARQRQTPEQALRSYDQFRSTVRDYPQASSLLSSSREQAFTCLRKDLQDRLAPLGGPEMGSGVLERVMRELNARTDIGGSRWSLAGLRDLVTIQLARMTKHPAWTTLKTSTHPPNTIPYSLRIAKFNEA